MAHGASARTIALSGAAALVAAGTAAVALHWDLRLAPAGSAGQVALDSIAATVGLSLAYLLYGRFRLSGLLRDLLLCLALLTLGGGNAVLSVLPVVLGAASGRLTAGGIVAGLVGALLFVLAVWLHPVPVPVAWRRRLVSGALLLGSTAVVVGLLWFLTPAATQPGFGATDTFGGTQDPVVRTAQLAAALAFLVAAAGWCRSSSADRMAAPLAVAAVFAAGSRISFATADEAATPWVTVGTVLRVLFYGALLAAAVLEVRGYWRRVAEAAVLEERRRLVRDLHDGLAQELAFIVTQARGLPDQATNRRALLIAGAAERALDESRTALAALTRPVDEPFDVALGHAVEEVAGRFDTRVRLQLIRGSDLAGPGREALLRIAREAVTNAGRHGNAGSVLVSLDNGDGLTLRVVDDGSGFDPDRVETAGRFGLTTMRERAEALGGRLAVRSRPGYGTEVTAWIP